MKDSFYFPHDYHARHDPKLERLRMEIGPVGDGIYWNLVEMMYEEGGYLYYKNIPFICKTLNTTDELIRKVVFDAQLFIKNGEKFYSQTLLDRLTHINSKRRKARVSGRFGGLAKAKRSPDDCLARKKESKERKESIYSAFENLWQQYPSKVGREKASIHFLATVKTDQDLQDINTALKNYLSSRRVAEGFVQNGSTWFNNWKDWINYIEPKKEVDEGQWGKKL
jgi:hypothetical protein